MSLDALATRGFFEAGTGGGGAGGTVTIAAVTPTPNTTPGAIGGMPADYASAKMTPIVVDITDSAGASHLAYIHIMAAFLDGTMEGVVRNGSFVDAYLENSFFADLSLGFRYTIERTAGWPGKVDGGGNLAVALLIDVVDSGGNVTTQTLYYQMPQQTIGMTPPVIPTPVPTAADMSAEALSLLVWQFRSS